MSWLDRSHDDEREGASRRSTLQITRGRRGTTACTAATCLIQYAPASRPILAHLFARSLFELLGKAVPRQEVSAHRIVRCRCKPRRYHTHHGRLDGRVRSLCKASGWCVGSARGACDLYRRSEWTGDGLRQFGSLVDARGIGGPCGRTRARRCTLCASRSRSDHHEGNAYAPQPRKLFELQTV